MIGEIIYFIFVAWGFSCLISLVIFMYDDDIKVGRRVLFLFPANLIFIIKYWWKVTFR